MDHSSSDLLSIASLVSRIDIRIYVFSKNVCAFSSAFLLTLGIVRLNFLANDHDWNELLYLCGFTLHFTSN